MSRDYKKRGDSSSMSGQQMLKRADFLKALSIVRARIFFIFMTVILFQNILVADGHATSIHPVYGNVQTVYLQHWVVADPGLRQLVDMDRVLEDLDNYIEESLEPIWPDLGVFHYRSDSREEPDRPAGFGILRVLIQITLRRQGSDDCSAGNCLGAAGLEVSRELRRGGSLQLAFVGQGVEPFVVPKDPGVVTDHILNILRPKVDRAVIGPLRKLAPAQ